MPAASVQLLIAALPQPCSIERVRFSADVEPPDRLLCIAYPLRTSGRDNPSALPVWWLVCRKVFGLFRFFFDLWLFIFLGQCRH
jgi:hypothetical protein